MTNRSVLTIALFLLALSLAACSSSSSREIPPAAQEVHPDWLTGTWRGSAVQVATAMERAKEMEVWITFSADGAWKAMTGATGSSWFADDRVQLEGTSPPRSATRSSSGRTPTARASCGASRTRISARPR